MHACMILGQCELRSRASGAHAEYTVRKAIEGALPYHREGYVRLRLF